MDEVDIFQRTLKCHDIPLEESESEIFEVESTEESIEEEAQIEQEPLLSEGTDYCKLYRELECAKRQLQKLLLLIKTKSDPCYKKPCPQPEMTCDEEAAVCQLRKAFHKTQCQIYELTRCFQCIREEIRDLHGYLCKQSQDILQLYRGVALVQYWQEGMKYDEGICYWRYLYIKETKAEWKEMKAMLIQEKRCHESLCEEYLTRGTFKAGKIYLQAELEMLKALFVELFELGNPNLVPCDDGNSRPLKKIEADYIKNQIRKNKKQADQSCGYIVDCDKVDL